MSGSYCIPHLLGKSPCYSFMSAYATCALIRLGASRFLAGEQIAENSEGESCNRFPPSFDGGLLLIRSHGARRGGVHLMHNSANAERRWGGRLLTVRLLAPSVSEVITPVFSWLGCIAIQAGAPGRRDKAAELRGHFFISVTSAA